ncbi:MAG: cation:proton antiporter [Staphylococcus sp.]|nr:cation:proton antiporter [Staphylococcus sp.]
MFIYLSSTNFDLKVLLPIVILLGLAAIIPVILAICRIKFIPVLVIEILTGILLASFSSKEFFVNNNELTPFMEGLYSIGMGILLFLSGLDTDFTVLGKHKKGDSYLHISRLTTILLFTIILCSIGGSFLFLGFMNNKVIGVIVLTIIFCSTFASIVIPLVHEEGLSNSTIGKIISSYSTKAELLSIVALSILMMTLGMTKEQKPWLLLILVIILLIVYIFSRYLKLSSFKKISDGIVHFGVRLTIALLLGLMILCSISGVEYILGAFLAGMVIKSAKPSETNIHKLEIIGYGIFVPIFYMLVGLKIGLLMPIQEIFKWENLSLILILFGMLIIVKIPFMYLCRWFNFSTVIQTTLFVACTLIVVIASEEFGVFTKKFMNALIIASSLTCIIPPILFDITKRFGYSKKENDIRIINPVNKIK